MPIQRGDSRYSNYPKNTQLEQDVKMRSDYLWMISLAELLKVQDQDQMNIAALASAS